jgi:hypothetical protein
MQNNTRNGGDGGGKYLVSKLGRREVIRARKG